LQHLAIVGVRILGGEPFLRGDAAGFIVIGDGDDLSVRNLQPDDIEPVPIVAAIGAADNGDAIVWHDGVSPRVPNPFNRSE
jgi:hypothetical protein